MLHPIIIVQVSVLVNEQLTSELVLLVSNSFYNIVLSDGVYLHAYAIIPFHLPYTCLSPA